jgi:hypothetical protein
MNGANVNLTVITPDGHISTLAPAGKRWTIEEWQAAIGGGYVEMVYFPGGVALCDEEGLLKGQLPNGLASEIVGRPLVGTVAIGDRSLL